MILQGKLGRNHVFRYVYTGPPKTELLDSSGFGMIDDEIHDNTVMIGV